MTYSNICPHKFSMYAQTESQYMRKLISRLEQHCRAHGSFFFPLFFFFISKVLSLSPNPISVTFTFSDFAKFENSSNSVIAETSIASFCRPEACGVTPSATLAPSQRWLLCPAGHTHCLALSSYTTPKQTADHPQRFKKDEEVVQRWPLKSNFLILVTSSVSLGPSFPSLSIHAFVLQHLKCRCWHLWAGSHRHLMCYQVNGSSSMRVGVDRTLHLFARPASGGRSTLSRHCISQRLDTLDTLALFSPSFTPCQPTARLHPQPTLTEQTNKHPPACFGSPSMTCHGF